MNSAPNHGVHKVCQKKWRYINICELLGVSSNIETTIEYSSQSMIAHSTQHKNGWGVAFYPENSSYCRIIKEPEAMEDAGLYKYMQDNHSIHSKIILNHIRYMAGGEQKYENTHPFVRELFGQDWALIHNGARGIDNFFGSYLEQNPQIDFVPLGTTGSEKALCIILNEIKKRVPSRISTAQNGGNLRVYTDYEFSEVEQVVYETCVDIQESGANLNILLSNGDHLIAFHSGYNKLHYTIRDGSRLDPGKIKLTARCYC